MRPAAYQFLDKALKTMPNWQPCSITTDKVGSDRRAIRPLQCEGKLSPGPQHRTSKYLNNIIEADHGGIKRVTQPTRSFQRMKTAYATINGLEIMRMISRSTSPPLRVQSGGRDPRYQQAPRH
jgi:transposase, IS6 family